MKITVCSEIVLALN